MRDRLPPCGFPEERRFQPWVRIPISCLPRLWFLRPVGGVLDDWELVVKRDGQKFDLVN